LEGKTLAQKAADELVRLIREQGSAPGDKLPNEYELSALLGVGRNTVREAVRMLASRNIVDIRQGAGTFVSEKMGIADDPLGFTLIEDRRRLVADLLQVRCIIEPQLAALAAQNATAQDIGELERRCGETEELIVARTDFSDADRAFHVQIARCSHNLVMSNLLPVISAGVTFFAAQTEREFEQTVAAHRKIFEAIRDRRGSDAQQAMQFHLLFNQNRFLDAK
jgi:DNA-binding FadR family transcriptional regulator